MVARSAATHALADRPWASLRWLVIAPHPDDETLGAGALIAQAAACGRFGGLVYLTDGSGSHDHVDEGSRRRLIDMRRREGALALRRLTGRVVAAPPVHLDWQDANPAADGDPAFALAGDRLAALCVRLRIDAIAVTAGREHHCDHRAAAQLAYAVQSKVRRRLVVAEYIVWSAPPRRSDHLVIRTAAMRPGRRTRALAAHRSQLTSSNGQGFRLPADVARMSAFDLLYIRRHRHAS